MTDSPQYDYADRIPLVIRRGGLEGEHPGAYSIKLGGMELGRHLISDGLKIEWGQYPATDGPSQPTVTLTLSPGATEVDLDAELIGYLRAKDDEQSKPATESGD